MNLATTPPPRQTLAQQFAVIHRQVTAPKRAAGMINRVLAAIAKGERLPGRELVKRIGGQGVAESTARQCIYAAVEHGVLASLGERETRTYWLTGKLLEA